MAVSSRLRWAAVGATVAVLVGMLPAGTATAVANFSPDPSRPCADVTDTLVSNGRVAGCVDSATVSPSLQALFGTSGLDWVDLGAAEAPGPTQCSVGPVSREDGWAWRCVVKDGQHVLVKAGPWKRPAQLAYAHTASRTRATVTVSANVPLTGCRLTASDKRLLRGQQATLAGRTARRTLDTSGLRAGDYTVGVTCRDRRLTSSSDLRVLPDGSALLRSDCLDAWHDSTYADVVPGYGRRLTPASAESTATACRALAPLTADEYARAGRDAYVRIGQLAEREVRRVSASRGIPICQAIAEVFKPVDTVGRRLPLPPGAADGITVPVAGYLADGYFPVLYRQWTGGPVRMDSIADCGTGNQSLRLTAPRLTCSGERTFAGQDVDPHQTYPLYVFDRTGCPESRSPLEINPTAVCIVWSDRIGNNASGGVGKVFAAAASGASGTGPRDSHTFDCEDRALKAGQFANVDVQFASPLT